VIAGTFGLRVQGDEPSDRGDRRLCLVVVLVGVVLVLRADPLANDHRDLVVFRRMDTHGTASVDNLQAGSRRKILLDVVVEVVVLPKDVREVAVIKIDLIADSRPVHALDLSRHQTRHHDHDDQENSSGADSAGANALALRLLVLDQLDQSPQDQQGRPIVREQMRHAADREIPHRAHQADDADDDQDDGRGERAMPRR
jgi:hypothetical protein